MSPAGGTGPVPDLPEVVAYWSGALRGTCYVPLTPDEREGALTGLVERLAGALRAEPFEVTAGYWVGTELLDLGFTAPEALYRSLVVLHERLPAFGTTADAPARTARLTSALAAGFAAAVHEHTLDAQDASQRAILTAKDRVERALRDSEARFRYVATHDYLTRLPNRTQFTARLAELLERAGQHTRLGLCCVDLDGFAAVNDSLGRDVGDWLLTVTADRLRAVAGEGQFVARLEGDQFAILIADTSGAEDAMKAADRALAAVAAPFHVGGLELPLTASAGVVERAAAGTTGSELCRAAEAALHWAKADGRGRWRLYERERAERDAVRYRLSAAMPTALRERQFTLAYQPLVDLATGSLSGVEALARWRHPDYGLLGADRFIGLAHDTGLIVPLGAQLLRQAAERSVAWPSSTPLPLMSVNLAERQLRHPGLVADVAQVLDRTGLAPERLQLEITEHAVIGTGPETIGVLHRLARLGVRIALDDFGTGYANLACLRELPLHAVKLDASIVRALPGTGQDGTDPDRDERDEFLATVVSLGHTLGLSVTAEGIETAAQAATLRAAGCDTGQGWHFGRPASAEAVARRYGSG